jgi:hypothetical protein
VVQAVKVRVLSWAPNANSELILFSFLSRKSHQLFPWDTELIRLVLFHSLMLAHFDQAGVNAVHAEFIRRSLQGAHN